MTLPNIDELIEKLPTGYTPGPWRFERHQRHSNWHGNIVGSYGPNERGNEQIRTITCQTRYGDPDERDANAALIALAPEMAAALSTLQEQKRKLEEALKPFAKACNISTAEDSDCVDDTLAATKITWGDLRRARALLSGGE